MSSPREHKQSVREAFDNIAGTLYGDMPISDMQELSALAFFTEGVRVGLIMATKLEDAKDMENLVKAVMSSIEDIKNKHKKQQT